MAVAPARVVDLESGDLPAVCAKTGVACDGLVKDTLRVVPRWVSALAILLLVPYLVGRLYTGRKLEVKLPIAPDRIARIRRMVQAAWVALVVAAAGFTASLFGAGGVAAIVFLVGIVGYIVIVYVGDQMWVGARPSDDDELVVLTRVHPAFAAALAAQYEAAR